MSLDAGHASRRGMAAGGSQAERRDDELLDELCEDWQSQRAGLPDWPRYDKAGAVFDLDREAHAAPDTTRARYEFLLKGLPEAKP